MSFNTCAIVGDFTTECSFLSVRPQLAHSILAIAQLEYRSERKSEEARTAGVGSIERVARRTWVSRQRLDTGTVGGEAVGDLAAVRVHRG
jgi:hypothetical protein